MKGLVGILFYLLIVASFGGCCNMMYSSIPPYGGPPVRFGIDIQIDKVIMTSPHIDDEGDRFIQGLVETLNMRKTFYCNWCGRDTLPIFEFRHMANAEYDTIKDYSIDSRRPPVNLMKMKNPPILQDKEFYIEFNDYTYVKDSVFNGSYAIWNHARDSILRVGYLGPHYLSDESMTRLIADYLLIQLNLLD